MNRSLFPLLLFLLTIPAHAEEEQAAAGKDVTIEEFLQGLSSVNGVVSRKDPFVEVGPPFEIPAPEMQAATDDGPVMGAPVLERYPLAEYEVVAVLLGDKYPRALLRLPKDNTSIRKVVIIKEKDKLGSRKGVVDKITTEGLVIQQAQRSKHGFVDKTEVLLKVGGTAEQQKISLSAIRSAGGSGGEKKR